MSSDKEIVSLMSLQEEAFKSQDYKNAFSYAEQLIVREPKDYRFYRRASHAFTELKEDVIFSQELVDTIGNLTLENLRLRSEYRTYRFWHCLTSFIYRKKIEEKEQAFNKLKSSSKPRVFFFCQNIKESKTSSHLAIVADLIKNYEAEGIEAHLVITPNPYAGLGKRGAYAVPDNSLSEEQYANSIRACAYELSGIEPNKMNVTITSGYRDEHITLNEFIDLTWKSLSEFSISGNDLIFLLGGVNGSSLLCEISRRYTARKFFFMMSGNNQLEPVSDVVDYVLYFSGVQNKPTWKAKSAGFPEKRLIGNDVPMKPFFWEGEKPQQLSVREQAVLEILDSHTGPVFVSASLNFEKRINQEFTSLLLDISKLNAKIVIIGTSFDKMKNSFPDFIDLISEKIEFIERSESIYTFFIELAQRNSYYIFPRVAGSGRTNTYAGLSGMPVFLFKGNDAERRFPSECLYDDKQSILTGINTTMRDKKSYVEKTIHSILHHEQLSYDFYMSLLDADMYPPRKEHDLI